MLKKNSFYFLLILLATISFSGCKNYDEGPGLTLVSATQRVSNTWKVESYIVTILGADVDLTSTYSTYQLTFTNKGVASHSGGLLLENQTGTWEFTENKDKISIELAGSFSSTTWLWTIEKLTEKEFWVTSTETSGAVNHVRFVPL